MIWSVNEHQNICNLDNVAHLTKVFVGMSSDSYSGSDSGFKMLITAGGKKCMTNDLDGWVVSKCHNWKTRTKISPQYAKNQFILLSKTNWSIRA